jgi:hypothetical protein
MMQTLSEMTIGELAGSVLLLIAAGGTVVQLAPIKINPWTWLARVIGRAINGEVITMVQEVKKEQSDTRKVLDKHIKADDERNADLHRARILQFNNELLRSIPHTREDFIEVLAEIDFYTRYCTEHPEYENHRAVHAIANIERVYDDRLRKHDFL